MKILWFSNVPLFASNDILKVENKGSGNWISSLEKEISLLMDIELAIAFHTNNENINQIQTKENNSVKYFLLPRKKISKAGRILKNWTGDYEELSGIPYYHAVIERFNPDVIHIFGFENSFIKILPKYNEKTIVHIQGIVNAINQFIYGRYSKLDLLKTTSIRNLIKGEFYSQTTVKRFKKMALSEAEAFKSCKFLFGRTEWDKRVSQLMAPNASYFHCHEIMREEFYKNKWNKKRKDEIVLYSTSNDIPYKGIDQIMRVNELLKEHMPNLKYKWRVAGAEETSMSVKVLRKKGFKKCKQLEFVGKLSAPEITGEMKNSDLFIYPSYIENGCNAVQEAMLLGMPVICTAAGGVPSIIDNGKTGLLVQPGDSFAMAGAILELINNSDYAKNLGKNAREKTQVMLDKKKIVETTISAYLKIMENQ